MKRFKELSVPFPALVAALFSVFTPSAIAQTNCVAPPAGLVSWWRAEGNASDQSGANHAALVGNTTFGTGVVGQCFVFDGDGDGVRVTSPVGLQLQDFTVEAWIKRASSSVVSGHPLYGVILGWGGGGYGLGLRYDGQMYLSKVELSSVGVTNLVTDTNWHHVAVTKSGSNVILYVDGVGHSTPAYDPGFTFSTPLAIGAQGDNLAASFFGAIDEPSVYNRALSGSEIQAIYEAGSSGKCTVPPLTCAPVPAGLVSWWRAEGNASDQSGANHGTLAGDTTYGPGRVGQAFVFDGNGDGVAVGNPASLQLQNFTIEAWVKRHSSSAASGTPWGGLVFGCTWGGYGLGLTDNGQLYLAKVGYSDVTSTLAITDTNDFHHVVVTKNGGTVVFFLDGVAETASPYDPGFVFGGFAAIGARGDDLVGSFLGSIDEVTIYNRALAGGEVQAIYSAGSSGKCTTSSPPLCATPPAGLVSWWTGNGNPDDTTGTNHGTFTGPSYSPGKVGQAFSFDGSGNHVRVPASSTLNVGLSEGLTIEAWINPTDLAQRPIVEWAVNDVYAVLLWANTLNPGSLYAGIFGTDGSSHIIQSAGGLLATNTFQHVAVTYDKASGIARLLINGVMVKESSFGTFTPLTGTDLYIGYRPAGTPAGPVAFRGLIDEVSIYNRALSAGELQSIYNSGSSGKCATAPPPPCATPPPGLVSWWRAEGSTLDQAGTNTGTSIGNVTFGPGRVGQAFVFDGSGDGVSVGNPASLQLQTFTIEAWIKRSSTTLVSHDPYQSGILFSYSWGGYGFALWDDGRLFLTKNGSSSVFSTLAVTDTNFHHVAVTKTGGTVIFYLDGVAETVVPYNPGFTFGGPAAVGARGGDFAATFLGAIDELSVYDRALSPTEVQSIYGAATFGKCVEGTPPLIVSHPADRTVTVGDNTTFSVAASGTAPLSYQWRLNGSNIGGATSTSLVLENVQFEDAGIYSVIVSNFAGTVTSSNAVLAVNQAGPCVTPPTGLVGWWKGEGSALDNASTNHGTLAGNTDYGTGRVGQTFVFDGRGDAVSVGNPASLRLQTFTIEAWIKRSSTTLVSLDPYRSGIIFSYATGGYGFALWDDGRLFLTKNGSGAVYATLAITDTNFHHVAVTKSGSTVVFYLDGVAEMAAPYNPGFTFGGSAAVGARGGDFAASFLGSIDEVSVYNRALTAGEIQSVHSAGASGKCDVAPFIASQPTDQAAIVGGAATFTVGAAGTQPLNYQWQFNGTNLSGATASSLVLANVQLADAGSYSVVISNLAGTVTSSNATLTVNLPPATVAVASLSAAAGAPVALPIVLTANGNENALGFSLNFDSTRLTYTGVSLGSGAAGAALLVNTNQVDTGKLGIAVALATDTTFHAGANEVVLVGFTTAVLTDATSTTLIFGDVPINRQVSDAPGNPLAANYLSGTISIGAVTYEGDIAPRPNGDQNITITDWVLAGRYAARLDYPTNASEFQRADTAPRATLGDGAITVTDWVQTGRYAAALDPLTPVGGPEAEVAGGQPNGGSVRKADGEEGSGRQIAVLNGLLLWQQTATLSVSLKAQGDENALGFSLAFDPELVTFAGAAPGSDANGATLNVNATQAGAGRLGFVLGLGTGSSFAAGNREVVKLTFNAATAASAQALITLTDLPVPRQVSDPAAFPLAADYVSGMVAVNPLPVLNIARADENLRLSWPLWATNFVLQQAEGSWNSPTNWTQLEIGIGTTADENVVTMPLSDGVRFYRLYCP